MSYFLLQSLQHTGPINRTFPPPADLPLCQWAHELRVVTDECWVHTLALKELPNQLVQQAASGLGGAGTNAQTKVHTMVE